MTLRSARYALLAMALAAPLGAATVAESFPLLTSGFLATATVADLPAGVILQTPGITITEKDLATARGRMSAALRPEVERRPFALLDSLATDRLLEAEGEAWCREHKLDLLGEDARGMYLTSLAAGVKVPDAEVEAFYRDNKEVMGGATLEQARGNIRGALLQQARQQAVVDALGRLAARRSIKLSRGWLDEHYQAELSNPVDAARRSGRPSLVEFGGEGCEPCMRMAPILARLREDHAGKLNVVTSTMNEAPVLAARFGVVYIPVQLIFDRNGKERFRHVGFCPEATLRARLAELGVK